MRLDKSMAHDLIRARVRAGAKQREVALALGVSRQHVSRLIRDLGLDAHPRGRPRINAPTRPGFDAARPVA